MKPILTDPSLEAAIQASIIVSFPLVSEERLAKSPEPHPAKRPSRRTSRTPQWVITESDCAKITGYSTLRREANELCQIHGLLSSHFEKRIRPLHRIHNSRVPINRLSNHILRDVLVESIIPSTSTSRAIRLVSVCSRWADVLRSTPDLWTMIKTERWPDDLVRAAILHSGSSTLDIQRFPSSSRQITALLEENKERFFKMTWMVDALTAQIRLAPMKALRHLVLAHQSKRGPWDKSETAMVAMDATGARLLHLEFRQIWVAEWAHHFGDTLRQLTLRKSNLDQTAQSFLDSLTTCRALQGLEIEDIHLSCEVEGLPSKRLWTLPELEGIHVHSTADPTVFVTLMNHIHAPKCTSYDVDCDFKGGWSELALEEGHNSMGSRMCRSLLTKKKNTWELSEAGDTTRAYINSYSFSNDTDSVCVVINAEKEDAQDMLRWITTYLASQQEAQTGELTLAYLRYETTVTPFLPVIKCLKGVRSLWLEECSRPAVDSIFTYLSALPSDPQEPAAPVELLPFPYLDSLTITGNSHVEYAALRRMIFERYRGPNSFVATAPRGLRNLRLRCIGDEWPYRWKEAVKEDVPHARVSWE